MLTYEPSSHWQRATGVPPKDLLSPGVAFNVAAVAVGFAIDLQDGEYTPAAMALITLALVGAFIGVIFGRARTDDNGLLTHVVWLAVIAQLFALFFRWPGVDFIGRGTHSLLVMQIAVLASAAAVCGIIFIPHGIGHLPENGAQHGRDARATRNVPIFLVIVAIAAGLYVWMIVGSPSPHIDVWVFQQQGAEALVHGRNPYAMTFPDIYDSTAPGHQPVYGPGLSVGGRLQFGFPYLPASLLLSTLGYVVAGDHRYAQAATLVIAGLFLGFSRRTQVSMLAATLLLFTPRALFVLGRGWTEPFLVMFLAATLFCACRRRKFLPLALGLFIATKQYMVVALPLTFFLLPPGWRWRDWISLLVKTVAVAAIVTLPLALWDLHAFWHSTVTVQEKAPFRWDALSYLVWYGFRGHLVTEPRTALIASTVALVVTFALSLWRAPRTPAGFAAALCLIFLAFFAFNKQAFCNYYFFVVGAACCAVAAIRPTDLTSDLLPSIRTATEQETPSGT